MDLRLHDNFMDHFRHPRNVGQLPDANGVGHVGNPVCGDTVEMSIRVREDIIQDARFKTFGCGAAVAASSIMTEMAKGMSVDTALSLSSDAINEMRTGLSPEQVRCSALAEQALQAAVEDYKRKKI